MKKILLYICVSLLPMIFAGCQQLDEVPVNIPTITTLEADEIGVTSATIHGEVENLNSIYCYYYFLVSEYSDFPEDLTDRYSFRTWEPKESQGIYAEVTDLHEDATYYYVLCATDGTAEVRGEVLSFRTLKYEVKDVSIIADSIGPYQPSGVVQSDKTYLAAYGSVFGLNEYDYYDNNIYFRASVDGGDFEKVETEVEYYSGLFSAVWRTSVNKYGASFIRCNLCYMAPNGEEYRSNEISYNNFSVRTIENNIDGSYVILRGSSNIRSKGHAYFVLSHTRIWQREDAIYIPCGQEMNTGGAHFATFESEISIDPTEYGFEPGETCYYLYGIYNPFIDGEEEHHGSVISFVVPERSSGIIVTTGDVTATSNPNSVYLNGTIKNVGPNVYVEKTMFFLKGYKEDLSDSNYRYYIIGHRYEYYSSSDTYVVSCEVDGLSETIYYRLCYQDIETNEIYYGKIKSYTHNRK